MFLLIDMGNTRSKLSFFDPGTLTRHSAMAAFPHHEINHITDWLKQMPPVFKTAYGIKVVSDNKASELELLLLSEGVKMQWLDGTTPYPRLANCYQFPQKLGPDRWFSAIGILDTLKHSAHSVVHASFGTATTIDTIHYNSQTQQHHFLGGTILPGPLLMHQSLASQTANLGFGEGKLDFFPSETRSAITTGIAAAQVGAVLRQWSATYDLSQQCPVLVCSGGGRHYIEAELHSALQKEKHYDPSGITAMQWHVSPALDGIAAITREQQSKNSTT